MNDPNSNKNCRDSDSCSNMSPLKAWFLKNKIYMWNIVLFSVGIYLVWKTVAVLLNIIGCLVGLSLVFFALNEMRLLHPAAVADWVLRKLRGK
jgi:hypothetical protein